MGYNERLFSSGFRKTLHLARFKWLTNCLTKLNCPYEYVIELGCFDGKTIEYLPSKPMRYMGIDANVEGGLDIAKEKWAQEKNFTFQYCLTPSDMKLENEQFDIAVCMETLEHVPPTLVKPYLEELSKVTKEYIFISIPNEKGLIFFLKYLVKKLIVGDVHSYTLSEFVNATLGRMNKVERNEHKGFDYQLLIKDVAKYFDIYEISGIPFNFLPLFLNFQIGIIGKKKLTFTK
ncbi:Ubiquinone biosynthesis O-methyl transferase [Beggiatoa sp. PS]|nr:Ubiquinone biosynthesis O-methyl transferase [Beggiatoa sp. PS]